MVHRPARRLLTVILVIVATLGAIVAGALATGRVAIVGTHGVSMNPVYYQGDLVIVAKDSVYEVGEIAAYRADNGHIVVLHRIIGGDANGFIMKGDNNQSVDPMHPTASQMVGRALIHVPGGGLWLDRLTSPIALVLLVVASVAGSGTAIHTRRRRRRAAMSEHARPHSRPVRSVLALPPQVQAAMAAVGVAALAGLMLGVFAWHAPVEAATTTTSQLTRAVTFSYSAAVAPSAAYDGTTVTSPEPVYRRLTNTVDLHLVYDGRPGTVAMNAQLSTADGWKSTVPLAAAATFTEPHYEASVALDLAALDARAQAAAAATGIPVTALAVAVVPTITTADGTMFTPTLDLKLTPLQMTLAGTNSLTVQDLTTVKTPSRVTNTLALLGRTITVSRARILSAILFVGALLGAVALTVVIGRNAAASEGAGIRRRYAALLASVYPITTPADHPVIEVAEFATLAKLAERCGLLVLHWSRADVETFIVLDENTTYRYRTGVGDRAADTAPVAAAARHQPEVDSL